MSMKNEELLYETLKRMGKTVASVVQEKSAEMTGTELNGEKDFIPSFAGVVAKMNMLDRPVGFVCKSSAGRVVKLLQVYDSSVYTQEPEELPAQWGFVWSQNPEDALPFIALSTSPYMKGDCCTENDKVYRSTADNNVWSPSEYPANWKAVE